MTLGFDHLSTTVRKFLKAVICTKYGPPEVLQLRDIEKPIPRDNEVLIKVNATTCHIGDVRIRSFNVPFWQIIPFRIYLGILAQKKHTGGYFVRNGAANLLLFYPITMAVLWLPISQLLHWALKNSSPTLKRSCCAKKRALLSAHQTMSCMPIFTVKWCKLSAALHRCSMSTR